MKSRWSTSDASTAICRCPRVSDSRQRLKGVPMLLIVTPDGKLVNRNDVFATTNARGMTPKALADYLAKYAK